MIDSVLAMILSLDAEWELDALTGVTFWFQENIAAGRVLSALMIAGMRGCRVRWNLMLRERDITSDPTWERQFFATIPVVEFDGRRLELATSPAKLRRFLHDVLDGSLV